MVLTVEGSFWKLALFQELDTIKETLAEIIKLVKLILVIAA